MTISYENETPPYLVIESGPVAVIIEPGDEGDPRLGEVMRAFASAIRQLADQIAATNST